MILSDGGAGCNAKERAPPPAAGSGLVIKPEIDVAECKLCEVCRALCPEIFLLNPAGYMEVAELEAYPEEELREAAALCPADCIRLVEE